MNSESPCIQAGTDVGVVVGRTCVTRSDLARSLVSTSEAAAILGLTAGRIRQLITEGAITPVPLPGREHVFARSDIDILQREKIRDQLTKLKSQAVRGSAVDERRRGLEDMLGHLEEHLQPLDTRT